MRVSVAMAVAVLSGSSCASFYATQSRSMLEGRPAVTAFVDVTVVPMDSERLLPGQTVVVRDGVIAAVGPTGSVEIPSGAQTIQAKDKYLMPGLIDMHVHVVTDRRDMFLYVANGVTTVRNMAGFQVAPFLPAFAPILDVTDHLELRNQLRTGKAFGPDLFTTGQQLDGDNRFRQPWPLSRVVTSPAEAEAAVEEQHREGYDFVKLYHTVTPEVFHAIAAAADRLGMKVVGHVPLKAGLKDVLESRPTMFTLEHLNGFIDHFRGGLYLPPDELDAYAVKMKQAGIWACPTLVVWTSWVSDDEFPALSQGPGVQYISPTVKKFWAERVDRGKRIVTSFGGVYPARNMELYFKVAAALHRAQVPFLLGTDASSAYVVPGFSVHQELALLVKAGLTPYEALQAGTLNAATALGKADWLGTVAVGKRADLLLLDDNPLGDVGNAAKRTGVMVRGRYYTAAELSGLLEAVERSFH